MSRMGLGQSVPCTMTRTTTIGRGRTYSTISVRCMRLKEKLKLGDAYSSNAAFDE